MKRIFGIVVLLAGLFVWSAGAQERLVRLTRYEGAAITGISVSSAFEVYLVQSDQTRAVAEISEQLEERLDMTLGPDGIIRIGMKSDNNRRSTRLRNPVMKVTLYLPRLHYIKGAGATEIHSSGRFRGDKIEVLLTGASELEQLDVDASRLVVTLSGASEATIRGEVNDLDVKLTGASEAHLNIQCSTAKLNCTSAGELNISGSAGQASISATSGSEINASAFRVNRLTVTTSSAAHARVWAVESLEANATSASSVRYKGNPGSFSTKSSSAASVKKVD